MRLLAVLLLGTVLVAWVIHTYQVPWDLAFMDSSVHLVLAFLGMLILENAFGFYFPKGSFGWFRPVLILLLTLAIWFLGSVSLKFLLGHQSEYLLFLDKSIGVRILVLLISFSSFALLLIFHSELEDQLKLLQRKEHVEKMAKDAELYQLRQQLQPHFLFNSLNSINSLITRNPEKAREMVLQLSEFLRGTIRKQDSPWLTVNDEIAHLQLFLNIEKIRFGERLLVDFEIEEGARSLKIPPLLIQPLLENAVKHGLNSLTWQVTVRTTVKRNGDYLEIAITNPYDEDEGDAPGAGFGLEAVSRRLYLLFGRHDLLVVAPSKQCYDVWMKIPQYDQDLNH